MSSPHIMVHHHDEFGVVARNVHGHHLADHMLRRVGFEPVPGQALYALTEPHRDLTRRAQQAVSSLRAARLTVTADAAYDVTPPRHLSADRGLLDRRDRIAGQAAGQSDSRTEDPVSADRTETAGQASSVVAGPDVAFGVHPSLGVVAAVTDGRPMGERILREQGFQYQPRLDVYTLPGTVEYRDAVRKVARASAVMQDVGLAVAAQPHLAASVTAIRVSSRTASAQVEGSALDSSAVRAHGAGTAPAAVTSWTAAVGPRPAHGLSR